MYCSTCLNSLKLCGSKLWHDTNQHRLFIWLHLVLSPNVTYCSKENPSLPNLSCVRFLSSIYSNDAGQGQLSLRGGKCYWRKFWRLWLLYLALLRLAWCSCLIYTHIQFCFFCRVIPKCCLLTREYIQNVWYKWGIYVVYTPWNLM